MVLGGVASWGPTAPPGEQREVSQPRGRAPGAWLPPPGAQPRSLPLPSLLLLLLQGWGSGPPRGVLFCINENKTREKLPPPKRDAQALPRFLVAILIFGPRGASVSWFRPGGVGLAPFYLY